MQTKLGSFYHTSGIEGSCCVALPTIAGGSSEWKVKLR
jgi:hypothetical protein